MIISLNMLVIRNYIWYIHFFPAKLDGIRPSKDKRKAATSVLDDDYDDDPYDEREEDMRIGKKRVSYRNHILKFLMSQLCLKCLTSVLKWFLCFHIPYSVKEVFNNKL